MDHVTAVGDGVDERAPDQAIGTYWKAAGEFIDFQRLGTSDTVQVIDRVADVEAVMEFALDNRGASMRSWRRLQLAPTAELRISSWVSMSPPTIVRELDLVDYRHRNAKWGRGLAKHPMANHAHVEFSTWIEHPSTINAPKESERTHLAISDQASLFGGYLGGTEIFRRLAGKGPLNRDDRPLVVYSAPQLSLSC